MQRLVLLTCVTVFLTQGCVGPASRDAEPNAIQRTPRGQTPKPTGARLGV